MADCPKQGQSFVKQHSLMLQFQVRLAPGKISTQIKGNLKISPCVCVNIPILHFNSNFNLVLLWLAIFYSSDECECSGVDL